jgi:phage gp16-like protein
MSAAHQPNHPAVAGARRAADLRTIHVGAKRLGLDAETYREFLFRLTGYRSAAELDQAGRAAVIDEMRRLGFGRAPGAGAKRRRLADDPQARLARALWLDLAQLGALRDSSEGALLRFVRRMTGCDAFEWCTVEDFAKIIGGLESWRARVLATTEPAA